MRPATAGPCSTGGAQIARSGGGATSAAGDWEAVRRPPATPSPGRIRHAALPEVAGRVSFWGSPYASAGSDRVLDISHRWTSSWPMLRMRHVGRPLAAAIFTFGVASNGRLRTAPHRAHRYGPPPISRMSSPRRDSVNRTKRTILRRGASMAGGRLVAPCEGRGAARSSRTPRDARQRYAQVATAPVTNRIDLLHPGGTAMRGVRSRTGLCCCPRCDYPNRRPGSAASREGSRRDCHAMPCMNDAVGTTGPLGKVLPFSSPRQLSGPEPFPEST